MLDVRILDYGRQVGLHTLFDDVGLCLCRACIVPDRLQMFVAERSSRTFLSTGSSSSLADHRSVMHASQVSHAGLGHFQHVGE